MYLSANILVCCVLYTFSRRILYYHPESEKNVALPSEEKDEAESEQLISSVKAEAEDLESSDDFPGNYKFLLLNFYTSSNFVICIT
jgi:hypothetical protein